MENQIKTKRILSPYDLFLIIGVIVLNIVYSILTRQIDVVGSLAGIAGVICVVLVAKGSIWNYLFGVINVTLYACISYNSQIFGDAALNAFYYLPMQFIGWWQWRKRGAAVSGKDAVCHGAKEESNSDGIETRVKARRMTWTQRLLLFCGCAVLIVAVGFILRAVNDPQPFKDSATTVLSIVAQALMALAFMEQWVLWIITNIISVVMWSICVARGDVHAELMVIMWCFYLLNSINGFRVWRKLSKSDAE